MYLQLKQLLKYFSDVEFMIKTTLTMNILRGDERTRNKLTRDILFFLFYKTLMLFHSERRSECCNEIC